ncbi:helix-turn-helix domain-containing protein [Streptomyces sp. GMR22]|uniref:Helix-turn-helix domain-containing protein n=2 Tax=Streptomyces TaxID=1883 RepID=A0A6G4AAT2_9ACTN|nr:helix-turn-helix domain-containing protein [Streptomyces sp. GMR22]MBD3009052.1 helix-turn-helix domain-containing protein [Streptomyces sp. 5-10]NEW70415.1 helix-turn-helix domain-containing protein [Streptomyces rhizosphaericus]
MAAPTGPTVRRMQLGWELKRLRDEAGFTLAEAVDGLTFSTTKLFRVENGLSALPKAADLKALLDRYGVEAEDDVDFLMQIHRDSLNRGWWSVYRSVLPSGVGMHIGLENGARTSRTWQPNVVFGLLQTERYARELFQAAKPVEETTTEFVERHIQIRMERKKALRRRDNPMELWVIQDEASLRRVVGSSEVMREQYQEIETLLGLDNVTVQVLPMATPAYRPHTNFNLWEFGTPLPSVVQSDAVDGSDISDKETTIWSFSRRFENLRAAALAPGETSAFLQRLAREI